MRASDSDRQRTVEELRRHCAAGRLGMDEYAVRIERALSADTLEQLDELRADLPMMRIADPQRGGIRAARQPAVGAGPLERSGRAAVVRATPLAVAVVAVAVVVTAVVAGLAAGWAWAAVLLAGWLAGLLQGWLGRRPGRSR